MAALAIGAVFGALGTLSWQAHPSARVVAGQVAAIDDTASAIALTGPDDLADVGFGVVGVLWRDPEGPVGGRGWQRTLSPDGHPTCLTPDDEGREVQLGLVTDPGGVGRPASEVVAWLECGPRLASGGGS